MRLLVTIALVSVLATITGCSNDTPPTNTAPADVETRPQCIKQQQSSVFDEANSRKARSIAILKAEKVPLIEHLPLIETAAESTRRTNEQVAMRAMALCVVAVKGEGVEQEIIDKIVDKYQLASAFTAKETKFISNPDPTQHDAFQFAWRYECYWVMLWALGYVDTLERPDRICDVKLAVSFLREHGRDGFLKKANLRSQSEILDAADLIYRYHWAVVDARSNNRDTPAAASRLSRYGFAIIIPPAYAGG